WAYESIRVAGLGGHVLGAAGGRTRDSFGGLKDVPVTAQPVEVARDVKTLLAVLPHDELLAGLGVHGANLVARPQQLAVRHPDTQLTKLGIHWVDHEQVVVGIDDEAG